MKPLILGVSGPVLTDAERERLAAHRPAGIILFARNVEAPDQVRTLTDSLRDCCGDDLLVLIDQEGGRVQRLRPPHWRDHPPGAAFGRLYDIGPMTAIEAARLHGHAIAAELVPLGVNAPCLPLIDVPVAGAHDIIGDRAFSRDPMWVAALGAAVLRGLREGGVAGIIKHIPGHGRAGADSHEELPVVTADAAALEQDLAPFRALNDAPMAMTAHVRYDAWDAQRCASISPKVIGDVIRGDIGFDGLLMCDDLAMHALGGELVTRMNDALAAGCDVALHCTGEADANATLLRAAPEMTETAQRRWKAALGWPAAEPSPEAKAADRRDELLAIAA